MAKHTIDFRTITNLSKGRSQNINKMVDIVAPKQTLGKRPSMEDVMVAPKQTLGKRPSFEDVMPIRYLIEFVILFPLS